MTEWNQGAAGDLPAVPAEIRERKQWVVWQFETRDGKQTKVPYRVDGAGHASSTTPATWGTFEQAVAAVETLGVDGVGFVFTADDPYVGVDLDVFDSTAGAIVGTLDSYTERSVSGRGAHVILRGSLNGHPRNRKGTLEVYDAGRYFVMTGDHLTGTPATVEHRQHQLERVLAEFLPAEPKAPPAAATSTPELDDRDLLELALSARNGEKVRRLWTGDKTGYSSDSEADLALVALLAFWTGPDPTRLDGLFRMSALMRDKWLRDDYRNATLERALDGRTEFYGSTSGGSRVRFDEPAPDAAGDVDGVEVVDELIAFVRRFLVITEAQAVSLAFYVLHTHCFQAAAATPYIHVTAATYESGKTRALEVLAGLVYRPLETSNTSVAAVYRSIEELHPTLLVDEVDELFGRSKSEEAEQLRKLLNAGYTAGTPVLRCVGEGSKQKVVSFDVFGPKVLVGVGSLPRSLATRSLPIKMKKRHRGEPVERLRRKRFNAEAAPLRDRCAGWADVHVDDLTAATPHLPDELTDRQQDTAEPLLAIADAVGGEWPARLRTALIELFKTAVDVEGDEPTRLLADIRTVFHAKDVTELSTDDLLDALIALEESPWHEWMSTRVADPRRSAAMKLANRLRRFEIKATRIQSGQERLRGYTRAAFADAWERHLPPSGA